MDFTKLKSALDEAQERFHTPSYSITFCYEGKTETLCSGYQNLEQKTPTNGDTLYAIGSCTKSFAAGAICALVDQGKLTLDDLVKDYIPEFEMFDSYVTNHLTIRDMLCHRSGLPRHELSWYARLDKITKQQMIKMFRYLRPNQPFRYKWQYSNHMYALAGYVIERVTGKDNWQDVVRELLLKPLGITRAAFSPEEAMALGNCATPYLYDRNTGRNYEIPYANIGSMSAAGCIYMSTEELAKWDWMLVNEGRQGDKQILSKEMCLEMLTPQMIMPQENTPAPLRGIVTNGAYGLGLMMEAFRGHRLIHHGGHIDGFMADQSLLADDGFSCSILTNIGELRSAQAMRYVVMEHFLGGDEDWSQKLQAHNEQLFQDNCDIQDKRMDVQPKNAPCPVQLEDICGTYIEPAYGDIILTLEDGVLHIKLGAMKAKVVHYANQFFYIEVPEIAPGVVIEACVDIDAQGQVIGFSAGLDVEGTEKIHFMPMKA